MMNGKVNAMSATLRLSVIVPVYNEENTIQVILNRLVAEKRVSEVIVVNDGSTDETKKILQQFSHRKVRIFHKENGGKGSAVRYGLAHVRYEYVLIQDADLEYHPEDIPKLLEPIEKEWSTVVYGSRFLGPHSNLLFWHRVGNGLLNLCVNILFDSTLSDMETCYKVVPTELMKELDLQSNAFELEPEITCKILKQKINIFEVPITYVGRDFSQGKKITWHDGISALWTILKLRVT